MFTITAHTYHYWYVMGCIECASAYEQEPTTSPAPTGWLNVEMLISTLTIQPQDV